jgi:chromosome segregation ATPase
MTVTDSAGDALSYIKADRTLIAALHENQVHHDEKLNVIIKSQMGLERTQFQILENQARLRTDFVEFENGQVLLADKVSGLKRDVSGLKQDVSGLNDGQARLEDKVDRLEGRFDGLEALVRKGFGMDSEN